MLYGLKQIRSIALTDINDAIIINQSKPVGIVFITFFKNIKILLFLVNITSQIFFRKNAQVGQSSKSKDC